MITSPRGGGPTALFAALDALAREDFAMGPAWTRAHGIAQAREGDALHDRLHALLHRIEGDAFNARYWYRRAGIAPFSGSFAEEAAALRSNAVA